MGMCTRQNGRSTSLTRAAPTTICFVNAQRHDSGADTIPMSRTGFLGPPDSIHGDTNPYNASGYTTCFDPKAKPSKAQKAKMAKTCWEHWSPETFLWYIQKQAGPGGFVHIDNEDMIGDGPCGQIDIDGNRFVDSMQRPKDFDLYYARLVNQTAAANALLPEGAMKHPLIMYTDDFISTGVNDSTVFADSIIHQKDGTQQTYQNCTVVDPPGPLRVQMNMFYADGYLLQPNADRILRIGIQNGSDGHLSRRVPILDCGLQLPSRQSEMGQSLRLPKHHDARSTRNRIQPCPAHAVARGEALGHRKEAQWPHDNEWSASDAIVGTEGPIKRSGTCSDQRE